MTTGPPSTKACAARFRLEWCYRTAHECARYKRNVVQRHLVARRETSAARTCLGSVTVLAVASAVADRHPRFDRRVFAALNEHSPTPVSLRVVQQLGTPWTLPATALIAAALGRHRLALAAAVGSPLEKILEVAIKKARPTPRPLYVEPTALRDDAPVEGESFPSGHAAIAWAAASLVAPYMPRPARIALFGCAGASAAVRVNQGAHHPVDAVGGAALGVAISTGLTWAVGRTD